MRIPRIYRTIFPHGFESARYAWDMRILHLKFEGYFSLISWFKIIWSAFCYDYVMFFILFCMNVYKHCCHSSNTKHVLYELVHVHWDIPLIPSNLVYLEKKANLKFRIYSTCYMNLQKYISRNILHVLYHKYVTKLVM